MEKTTTPKKKVTKKKVVKEVIKPFYDDYGALIYGYKDMEELVSSVYQSSLSEMLQGRLVFALRPGSSQNSPLQQMIIVKNPWQDDSDKKGKLTYTIAYSCGSHTAHIPCAIYNYLEEFIPKYLGDWGINIELIELYKQTIEKFKITE